LSHALRLYNRIRKKYPQNLQGEQSEQIESYEEIVAKDDLPNESMKTDKAMEFDLTSAILSATAKRMNVVFPNKCCLCSGPKEPTLSELCRRNL
jgi:hypothetical protein